MTNHIQEPAEIRMRVIVSALIRDGDRYLFIKQSKEGGAYPNTLHIPGGGLELGEDPDDAVQREIREETGLEVENLQRFDFDGDITEYRGKRVQFVFLRYTCDRAGGTQRAGSDASELLWVARSELSSHAHNPPSIRLLKKLGLVQ